MKAIIILAVIFANLFDAPRAQSGPIDIIGSMSVGGSIVVGGCADSTGATSADNTFYSSLMTGRVINWKLAQSATIYRSAFSTTNIGTGTPTYTSGTGVFNFPTVKRLENYSGTTNASGLYTIAYGTTYGAIPTVQFQINGGSNKQTALLTSSTTAGFTIYVQLRADVLGLLPTYSNVSGQAVDVTVFEK